MFLSEVSAAAKADESTALDVIQFAAAANQRYYPGLAVAVCSALMHLGRQWSANILVLDGGIEPTSKQQLIDLVCELRDDATLTFVEPHMSVFDGFPVDYGQSRMTYARLLLPGMLPDHKHVIYLDSDMIFLRDLGEIWSCANDKAVAAAPDYYFETIARDCPDPEAVGVSPDTPYFNAGLLVMNLDLWREHQVVERCLRYLKERPDWCKWWDQSALNVIIGGNFAQLGREWNTFSQAIPRFSRSTNYHYLSGAKPWLVHEESASTQPYYEYAKHLGIALDGNEEYVKSRAKSTRLLYLSPIYMVRHALRGALSAFCLRRWNALQNLKEARSWFEHIRYRLAGIERRRILSKVEEDFALHFPSRIRGS